MKKTVFVSIVLSVMTVAAQAQVITVTKSQDVKKYALSTRNAITAASADLDCGYFEKEYLQYFLTKAQSVVVDAKNTQALLTFETDDASLVVSTTADKTKITGLRYVSYDVIEKRGQTLDLPVMSIEKNKKDEITCRK